MKKFLISLVLLSVLAVLILPMVSLAQKAPLEKCKLKHDLSDFDKACTREAEVGEEQTKAWGMCCLLDAIYTATDWLFLIIVIVVAFLIVWGGFTIATAGGAPEKVASGKNFILYALIGLAVALLAKAFPSIVKALIGA